MYLGDFLIKTLWDYVGRWFPNPVEPGLREIGNPDKNSPVFVTSNFHLSVKRVKKALKGRDCYLLVAPTNGTNVWCASSGKDMNAQSIIRVIKTSEISEKVKHRKIILPQLSAPGINKEEILEKTGWSAIFGPVEADDIPSFLENDFEKTMEESKIDFPLSFRLEMLFSMNFIVWVLVCFLTFLLFSAKWVILVSGIFWGNGFVLYAGYPFILGKSGWFKVGLLALVETIGILSISLIFFKNPWWAHSRLVITILVVSLWLGFDLKGIVGGSSEAEKIMHSLGIEFEGSLYSPKKEGIGKIQQNKEKCTDCQICLKVCPKGVFRLGKNNEVIPVNRRECLSCTACVKQCPQEALSLE